VNLRAGAFYPLLFLIVVSCRSSHVVGETQADFDRIQVEQDGRDEPHVPSAPPIGLLLQLDQVLKLAQDQGLDLALARARQDVSAAEAQIARAAWIPELSLSADLWDNEGVVQSTEGEFLDVNKRNATLGVGLSLELDLAEALFGPRSASARLAAQRSATDAVRQSTRQRAAILFLDLLEAQFAQEIATEARAHAQEMERVERTRFESGSGLEVDYQRAQAHTAQVGALVVDSNTTRAMAAARLAQHLNLDPTRDWQAQAPRVLEQWSDGNDLLGDLEVGAGDLSLAERAERQRPELAAARARLRAARLDARGESRRWLLPTLHASVFEGKFGPDLNDGADSTVTAAGVTWNLALGMAGQAQRARAREAQARFELARLSRLVQAQVAAAHISYKASASRHDLAQARLNAAEAGALLAEQRHAAGAGLLLEALAAQSDRVSASMEVVSARVDRLRASWNLTRALGMER